MQLQSCRGRWDTLREGLCLRTINPNYGLNALPCNVFELTVQVVFIIQKSKLKIFLIGLLFFLLAFLVVFLLALANAKSFILFNGLGDFEGSYAAFELYAVEKGGDKFLDWVVG